MDALQLYQYKVAFNLKVRSVFGTAFQDFFSTVLEKKHGSDFVRVRPFGSVGDKGCDGYLASTGCVYQCFGKLQDAAVNSTTLTGKISADYALADGHLKSIMKEWHFGHNMVDGLPITAVEELETLKKANPTRTFGFVGPASLETIVLSLPPADLLYLLGPAATAEDSRTLNLSDVRDAVDALMQAIGASSAQPTTVKPVPADKLSFNKLPPHWVHLITAGSLNEAYVREYFERHPDATTGDKVAKSFSERYLALKHEGLKPGEIMDALYERLTGIGSVTASRQVAAHALLAYLFDACDIFEDDPSKVSA